MFHKISILFALFIFTICDSERNPRRAKHYRAEQVRDVSPPSRFSIKTQESHRAEHKHGKKTFKSTDYQVQRQWPLGVVPYIIDAELYDPFTIKQIVQAMGVLESESCVIFNELHTMPTDTKVVWLHITNPKLEGECVHNYSMVNESETVVVLGYDCLHPEEILHALLHGIGFKDEVTHPLREQYIKVQWANIQPKYEYLFNIQPEDASYKLVEYDPLSIMHFHGRAYSANGAATIVPLVSEMHIGGSHTLSQLDVMKLKLVFGYECNERKIDDLLGYCKDVLSPEKMDPKKPASSLVEEKHPDVKNISKEVDKESCQSMNEGANQEDAQNVNQGANEEGSHHMSEVANEEIRQLFTEGPIEEDSQHIDERVNERNSKTLGEDTDVHNDENNESVHNLNERSNEKGILHIETKKHNRAGDENISERKSYSSERGPGNGYNVKWD